MKHKYSKNEFTYLKSFENTTLDIEAFHHKEHLLVTYVLLIDTSIDESYRIIKKSILAVLESIGVNTEKYNETMTYAWVKIVKYFMDNTKPCKSFEEFISLNESLLNVNILYKHYSRSLISSNRARKSVMEADILDIKV